MKTIAVDIIFLRVVNPARLPYPSEVVASLVFSPQLSSSVLQSFIVPASRCEQIDVIAGTTVSTRICPRASPMDLPEYQPAPRAFAVRRDLALLFTPSDDSQRSIE